MCKETYLNVGIHFELRHIERSLKTPKQILVVFRGGETEIRRKWITVGRFRGLRFSSVGRIGKEMQGREGRGKGFDGVKVERMMGLDRRDKGVRRW